MMGHSTYLGAYDYESPRLHEITLNKHIRSPGCTGCLLRGLRFARKQNRYQDRTFTD